MPRCCTGSTCACAIIEGTHISVLGTGTASDPFVIVADIGLEGHVGTTFTADLEGAGTIDDPWVIAVAFSSTAKLDDLPDVNAPAPTNGYVLGWDSATSKWTPRAPTAAASGSVDTDTSLSGDGSIGAPLSVVADPAGYLTIGTSGVGLSVNGQNQLVLHYASDAARAVSPVTPQVNSLSMLDDAPGVTYYWTGSQWLPVTNGIARDFGANQMLAMSGAYAGGVTTQVVRQVSVVTDADGTFDVLSAADLTGAGGVLSCVFQETGPVPFKAMLTPNIDSILGTAYRLDDGTAYGSQSISGVAVAFVY
jgi:hypothetical protein